MKTFFVEFIDSETGVCFHADVYHSLKAVDELVIMWGNCFTLITDVTDAENVGEPVSAWWVAGEFLKLVALPTGIVLGGLWAFWHKQEIATWLAMWMNG